MEHTQSLLRGDLAGTQATCPGNHTGIKTRSSSISSTTAPEEAMEKLFIAAGHEVLAAPFSEVLQGFAKLFPAINGTMGR